MARPCWRGVVRAELSLSSDRLQYSAAAKKPPTSAPAMTAGQNHERREGLAVSSSRSSAHNVGRNSSTTCPAPASPDASASACFANSYQCCDGGCMVLVYPTDLSLGAFISAHPRHSLLNCFSTSLAWCSELECPLGEVPLK